MDFTHNIQRRYQGREITGSNTGFTLIEVLVATLVLAVGILGLAGMQAVGVQESNNLYFRTQADILLNDIIDRMRVNRVEARGAGTGGSGSAYDNVSVSGSLVSSSSGCKAVVCNSQQLAQFDVAKWSEAIGSARLPSAVGTITHIDDATNSDGTAVVGSVYTVQLFWDERRDGSGVSTANGCQTASAQGISCRSLTISI